MHIHSLHQHIIPAQVWYEVAHWWKVSRRCCEGWWFYEYLNVSWRSTPEIAGCWFQIPILILNDKESQLLNWKGIKCRDFVYWREACVQEMLFVMAWLGTERDWCGKYFDVSFFGLSWRLERFIVELHGDSRDLLWGGCHSRSLLPLQHSIGGLGNGEFRRRNACVDDLVARQTRRGRRLSSRMFGKLYGAFTRQSFTINTAGTYRTTTIGTADWLIALWRVLGRGMISTGVATSPEIVLFSFLDLFRHNFYWFEDSLVPLVDCACRGLSSLPGYHTRSLFYGEFCGFAANLDGLIATCTFFGEVGDHFLSL